MQSSTLPNGKPIIHAGATPADNQARDAILRELEAILSSPFFRTSNRSKEFLSYVVLHTLDGNAEPLKERTIGAKLFHRPVGYATGDDPVVRVQAGEVRRRLEQYHHASIDDSLVRIDLPIGSYVPEFRWASTHDQAPTAEPAAEESARVAPADTASVATLASTGKRFRWERAVMAGGLGSALAAALMVAVLHRPGAENSSMSQFWSPVLGSPGPVLICLAKPRVYRPSTQIYQKHAQFPGQFDSEGQRLSALPPLEPNTPLTWSDMVEYSDYGVAAGDVNAALRMAAALTRMGKESQVKIGTSYSFADLRNSPAIIVGAFNNRWTLQMTSNLHFAFVEENRQQMIRDEGGSGRAWHTRFGPHGEVIEDFGIVTRLVNSETGNFVVATAGIMAEGTQAAAEFVSSASFLDEALRSAPAGWKKKNLQVVLQTTVTDGIPGPPVVVAEYVW